MLQQFNLTCVFHHDVSFSIQNFTSVCYFNSTYLKLLFFYVAIRHSPPAIHNKVPFTLYSRPNVIHYLLIEQKGCCLKLFFYLYDMLFIQCTSIFAQRFYVLLIQYICYAAHVTKRTAAILMAAMKLIHHK